MRVLEIRIILSITILIAMGGIQDSFSLQTIEEKCEGGREISLDYIIQGKEVVKICDDKDSGSIFFGLEGTSHGTMQISLPFLGNHSNTAHFACAFEYFVLDNDEEILASIEETNYGKRITLDIKNNTKIIQIIAPSYLNESSWQKIRSCEKEFSEELSPKKQTFAGISIEEIYCRDDYVLTFKYTDNSPACVKPINIAKLAGYGWMDSTKFCYSKTGKKTSDFPFMCGLTEMDCNKYGGIFVRHGFPSPQAGMNYGWSLTCVLDYNLDRIIKALPKNTPIEIVPK